jgi:hypothetical protein
VDYEKVRQPEAIALSDVTLRDGDLQGDSLRTYLEAVQQAVEPAVPRSPPPARAEPALRLRLRLDGTQHEGDFLQSSPDSLWMIEDQSRDTLRYARSSLLQVQSYKGSTSASGRGALIGGGVGLAAAVGLIAAYSSEANEGSTGGLILGTAIFTAGGALLGAIVGSLFKKEEWVDAPNLSISMDASPECMKLSVRIGPIGRPKPN